MSLRYLPWGFASRRWHMLRMRTDAKHKDGPLKLMSGPSLNNYRGTTWSPFRDKNQDIRFCAVCQVGEKVFDATRSFSSSTIWLRRFEACMMYQISSCVMVASFARWFVSVSSSFSVPMSDWSSVEMLMEVTILAIRSVVKSKRDFLLSMGLLSTRTT